MNIKKNYKFICILLSLSFTSIYASDAEYYTKLYEGDYKLRSEVAYFQVYKAKIYPKRKKLRPVTLLTVNGKEIEDDSLAFEVLPGDNTFTYHCVGSDKEKYNSQITLALKEPYFYELRAMDNRLGGCFSSIVKLGKMKIPNSEKELILSKAKLQKGKPLPTSKPFNTQLDMYESMYPDEIWPDAAEAIYKYITAKLSCESYSVLSAKFKGQGRIWRDESEDELQVTGNMREYWRIKACGKKHNIRIVYEKPGNLGKYISVY